MPIVGVDPAADRLGVSVVSDDGQELKTMIVTNRKKGWAAISRLVIDPSVRVAIEGALSWGLALTLFLRDYGIDVIDVAPWQTAQLRNARPASRKTDPIDAFLTARAVQLWDLTSTQIRADDVEFGAIVAHRDGAVREQTARANRIQNLLGRFDPTHRDQLGRLRSKRQWEQLCAYDHPRYQMMSCVIRDLAEAGLREWHHIRLLTATVEALLPESGQRLRQLPGIDVVGAAVIVSRAGNLTRFRSEAAFASFVGVAPREHSSGNRTRNYTNRRGDRQLAGVFDTAIKTQLRTKGPAYDYVQKRTSEGTPRQIAINAATRKLVRKTWRQLKT